MSTALHAWGRTYTRSSMFEYMVEAGYDPQAAVELQELFVELSEGRQSSFIDGLFASHPPSQKRVEKNRERAREIGTGGYRGKAVYDKKLVMARKLQPAYDAHDAALKLASEKDMKGALAKVNEAIRIEPNEAMFYSLRGRIYQAQDDVAKAEKDFDKAVALYPEMFSYRLHNGLNALKQDKLDKAQSNLTRANELVPTSIAFLRLGDVAVKQNRRDDAIRYYSTAAEAGGEVAEEAKRKLANLTQ